MIAGTPTTMSSGGHHVVSNAFSSAAGGSIEVWRLEALTCVKHDKNPTPTIAAIRDDRTHVHAS